MKKNFKRRNELLTKVIKYGVSALTEKELDELSNLSDGVEPDKDNGIIDIRFIIYGLYIELYGEEVREFEDETTYKIALVNKIRYYNANFEEMNENDKDIFLELLDDYSLEKIDNELNKIAEYDGEMDDWRADFRQSFVEHYLNENYIEQFYNKQYKDNEEDAKDDYENWKGNNEYTCNDFDDWKYNIASKYLYDNYDEEESIYIEYLKDYATSIEVAPLDNMVEAHFQNEEEIDEDEYNEFEEEVSKLYNKLRFLEAKLNEY